MSKKAHKKEQHYFIKYLIDSLFMWFKVINLVLFNIIDDAKSHRNRLIYVVVALCFYTAYIKDSVMFGIAFGGLTIILGVYFKVRHESDNNPNNNISQPSMLELLHKNGK